MSIAAINTPKNVIIKLKRTEAVIIIQINTHVTETLVIIVRVTDTLVHVKPAIDIEDKARNDRIVRKNLINIQETNQVNTHQVMMVKSMISVVEISLDPALGLMIKNILTNQQTSQVMVL